MNKIRQDLARRIAGRLLRANEAGVIQLGDRQRPECTRAIMVRFVTPALRATLVELWLEHGPAAAAAGWEDPRPQPALDPHIDSLLERA